MEPKSTASYKTVRGLTRGLEILNALNREPVGASPKRISELTGIHRTTARRLLETLMSEGYVRRSPSDDTYRLTIKVRELSEGFRDEHWISAIAAPLLAELLTEVIWPTDLSTLDVDAMVVRETTHRFSRLSFHRSMVGRRLPLLQTATGLAYIAFCPDKERDELLSLLATRKDLEGEIARDPKLLQNLILRTQRKGFGENFMNWNKEERIASIAVPIRSGETVIACLNLVYIAEAMSIDVAAERYLPAMNRVKEKIEDALALET
ncbi:DNA-binding transcriptional regulator [Marinobacter sp.]|uniref:DNA-binding transcriptional regulator n=1 Tax=Marinobacter sp. TaxID=50741 RepID=UPI0035C7177B